MGYTPLRSTLPIDEATWKLAVVMLLPLVDGAFASLIITDALATITDIAEVGLLIFGGSAMLAIIVSEMNGKSIRSRILNILLIAGLLIPGAALVAMLAPTISQVIILERFTWFACLVILAIAGDIANDDIGAYLPARYPMYIVGIGLVVSLNLTPVQIKLTLAPLLIAKAVAAALIATGFALIAAVAGPRLEKRLDLDRFRFGSALALAVIPLKLLGIVSGPASLIVLVLAGVFACKFTREHP